MPIFTENPPLALYIHIPWCVQKCPYCDFNSHALKDRLPEELYVKAVLHELSLYSSELKHRPLVSIFFGGGTPSLFSAKSIAAILDGVAKYLQLPAAAEITLEANPGTIDQVHFADYRKTGVNRLSLGIQSLQDEKLKTLGRIHDRAHAIRAVEVVKKAGFDNFNLDIMYGLPGQSQTDALQDLHDALNLAPTHFSWYQLTIEPNTLFYHQRPVLPPDESIWQMQLAGMEFLREKNFQQYEVSAYATPEKQCLHNRNYWEFGDYLGIGAGAHSKITDINSGVVKRFHQVRHPKDFLNNSITRTVNSQIVLEKDLIFEFMLNALRLTQGFSKQLFTARTGIAFDRIENILHAAVKRGLLEINDERICPSELGRKFLNDLVEMFL